MLQKSTTMKKNIAILSLALTSALCSPTLSAKDFEVRGGEASLVVEEGLRPVAYAAEAMFRSDWATVFGRPMDSRSSSPRIVVCTAGSALANPFKEDLKTVAAHPQAFLLKVDHGGDLFVVGSDSHGAAYGLLEVSRLIGVSPWEWWADCTPGRQEDFKLKEGTVSMQWPSVEYRGIFINDEDWGLTPWSWQTNDPAEKGVVGPGTTERIFQLLLRLRANTYWPPMHGCSKPFFLTEGNREVARKYGIYIGTSHCEPMACNANGEWKVRATGRYDYATNRQAVSDFWESRVKDVADQEVVYTLGMRGEHDSPMLGAKTTQERKELTEQAIADQRSMLERCLGRNADQVPQVFIPYKEVLDIYDQGMNLPDDVTLMWCDDNYGYIRHFPTEQERARKGGNALYYHVSYWGRPHDYLWLGTFSPALLMQQMTTAYNSGIQKMWILNVGDIKPLEYQIELFMDLAWDFDGVSKTGVRKHLTNFVAREFGEQDADRLASILLEHYRLAYVHKPEFMGGTRTEEKDKSFSIVKDMPWSKATVRKRLADYARIGKAVEQIGEDVPADKATAYFHLVAYPVLAAGQLNRKLLTAQLARHSMTSFAEAEAAYDSIVSMTARYSSGKWKAMMDCAPRRLPVFAKVAQETTDKPWPTTPQTLATIDGQEDIAHTAQPVEELGYGAAAASIAQGKKATYEINLDEGVKGGATLELRLLPTHPMDTDGKLEIEVTIDGGAPQRIDYHTEGRSEEWKNNVLNNQAVRSIKLGDIAGGRHVVSIRAISRGVVVDQIAVLKS